MSKYLLTLPDRQKTSLESLKEQTSLSVAELLRRMIDHCCQDKVLFQIIPAMSGHVTVNQLGR